MAMESFNSILLPPALIPYSLLFLANPDWELNYLSYPESDIKMYFCSFIPKATSEKKGLFKLSLDEAL
ncbi:hypothetical protein [Butyrivibrio sp. VCD2006]|uniref:hypothetical protein n=1 Tax=Butyrivibrio sp. VCD2006 TaxID=1280664 RepID=UPI0012DF5342|nr:hypothetical protein [Butyrivibrio sp. VCD2006]